MDKPSVYISRIIPEPGMRLLYENCSVAINEKDEPPTREELVTQSRDCDGILVLLTEKIDDYFLSKVGNKLKVISSYSVGLDHIDVPSCSKRGIVVTHTPDVLTETTADFAFALILAAARRLAEGDRYVRERKWETHWSPNLLVGQEVYGSTIGVVGFGRIGKAVARRASGFGMKVIYFDRKGPAAGESLGFDFAPLDKLLRVSDVVSAHLPLTKDTQHFFGKKEFALMKKTAVFVNTSRGNIVDQDALVNALRAREIFAAGLDVFEKEPIDQNDPLLELENVVLAPHLGSASMQARSRMAELAAQNLIDGLYGRIPKAVANPEVLKR